MRYYDKTFRIIRDLEILTRGLCKGCPKEHECRRPCNDLIVEVFERLREYSSRIHSHLKLFSYRMTSKLYNAFYLSSIIGEEDKNHGEEEINIQE